MATEELEIVVGPNGEIEMTTRGTRGHRCMELLRLLENALGKAREVKHTHEFYETDAEHEAAAQLDQHVKR